jgi:hypothetical protein
MPGRPLPMPLQGCYSIGHPPSTRRLSQPAKSDKPIMSHSKATVARSALIFLLAGALGCASDVLLPDPSAGDPGAVSLTMFAGDGQTGTVGEPLPNPLVVKVLVGDQPAPGRQVAFMAQDAAAGTIAPDTVTTDSQGEAVAHWILGTAPGDHLVVAQLVGDDSLPQVAEFRAAAKVGAPATMGAASVQGQPGRRGQVVATAPVVQVEDRYGNPVPDALVTWTVAAGQGQVGSPSTVTDAGGKATVTWTLGSRRGVQKLTGSIGSGNVTGSPVTFTATVLF